MNYSQTLSRISAGRARLDELEKMTLEAEAADKKLLDLVDCRIDIEASMRTPECNFTDTNYNTILSETKETSSLLVNKKAAIAAGLSQMGI